MRNQPVNFLNLRCAALAAVFIGALVATGCAQTIQSQAYRALQERREPIHKIAVAPFSARLSSSRAGAISEHLAAGDVVLMGRYVSESLGEQGLAVVAPADVERVQQSVTPPVAAGGGTALSAGASRALARAVWESFGADALLVGQVHRFRERVGEALGATRPASVGFEVTLYSAPDGEKLWTAVFDETQQSMSENVFVTSRYPSGGSRWLSAEELARWGSQELARALPTGP